MLTFALVSSGVDKEAKALRELDEVEEKIDDLQEELDEVEEKMDDLQKQADRNDDDYWTAAVQPGVYSDLLDFDFVV